MRRWWEAFEAFRRLADVTNAGKETGTEKATALVVAPSPPILCVWPIEYQYLRQEGK